MDTETGISWGHVASGLLERVAVVSPHFDDAVLGATDLLITYPGSTVITVLGGRPPAYPAVPTSWDAAGGLHAGDDVVAIRQAEDRAAMQYLSAEPVWLDFPDHQYLAKAERPTADDVAPALEAAIQEARATSVFLPMGIANPDHVLTHEAGLRVRQALGAAEPPAWFCYEDHGYKHLPGLMAWRVATLFKAGHWPTPAIVPVRPDMTRKRAAIARYRTQVAPLERDHALAERLDANVPEQYWRLAPPPPGWERLIDSL